MIFGTMLRTVSIGLMKCGRAKWQEAEETRKDFNTLLTPSGQEILYFRPLQGHPGRNSLDPSLQDNVLIPNNFFEYIDHIGCAINLHSITNSGLILGRQNLSRERQTVFFTAVNPMDKEHKDPYKLDSTQPRLAWYKQKWKRHQELDLTKPRLASYEQKWERHQDTACWVDIQFAQRKGLKFYQTRSNAIILIETHFMPTCSRITSTTHSAMIRRT